MTYKLQVWGFIVGEYVTISEHATKDEAYAAREAELDRRKTFGLYTDIMTLRIDPPKEAKP